MNALKLGGSRRKEQHVPVSQKTFRAIGINDGPGIDSRRYLKRQAGREVSLDDTSKHIHRRPLSGQNKMDSGSPGHLRQPRQGDFHITGCHHHQIRQLINDDNNKRKLFGFYAIRAGFCFFHFQVELGDVSGLVFGEKLVAPLHFPNRPEQGVGGLFNVRNYRRNQMGNAIIQGKFDAFGINHDQLDLIRR